MNKTLRYLTTLTKFAQVLKKVLSRTKYEPYLIRGEPKWPTKFPNKLNCLQ